MKIKRKKINGYDVSIYKTKRYSTIDMRFLFQLPYTKENIYMCDVLEEYMLFSSKKYKTREAINRRRMELYSMVFGLNNYNIGESLFVEASFSFFDPELVNDDYIEEALEFASDLLFEPNFENGKLDRDEFVRSKDNIKLSICDNVIAPKAKAGRMMTKLAFPGTYLVTDFIETKEECEDLIESFSEHEIIELHKKIIDESLVGLIIMGNVTDEFLGSIEKFFKFKKSHTLDKKFKDRLKICKSTPSYTKVSDEDIKESILKALYECPARNRKERASYLVLKKMIDSTGLMLHKVLRDELKLVYTAKATYSKRTNTMMFNAFIDSKNEKKALEGFNIVLERLKDRDAISKLLKQIKEEYDLALYTFDESKWNPFFELYDVSFGFDRPLKKNKKVIDSLVEDDIIMAIEKMKISKILFYEGVKK